MTGNTDVLGTGPLPNRQTNWYGPPPLPFGEHRGEHRRRSMEIDTIGIDLGKTVFHVVGLSRAGEVVVRRKFSRLQLVRFTANLRVRLIGMEACAGSHF